MDRLDIRKIVYGDGRTVYALELVRDYLNMPSYPNEPPRKCYMPSEFPMTIYASFSLGLIEARRETEETKILFKGVESDTLIYKGKEL